MTNSGHTKLHLCKKRYMSFVNREVPLLNDHKTRAFEKNGMSLTRLVAHSLNLAYANLNKGDEMMES